MQYFLSFSLLCDIFTSHALKHLQSQYEGRTAVQRAMKGVSQVQHPKKSKIYVQMPKCDHPELSAYDSQGVTEKAYHGSVNIAHSSMSGHKSS